MALTAYCKKCGREVDAAEVCPYCGTRLGKNAAHAAWCIETVPATNWIRWNAVMRLLLPAALVILLLVLLIEGISGGIGAVEKMMTSGFPVVLLILLGTILAVVLLALVLQGKELTDYVVDNRGIHEIHYLPNPTPLKLLCRLKSPSLAGTAGEDGRAPVVKLSEKDLAWRDVARVQLWPEKCMILYYAPASWLRIAVECTPFTWDDVMGLTREKLGKKRKIRLPQSLVIKRGLSSQGYRPFSAEKEPQALSPGAANPPKPLRAPELTASPEVEEALEQLRMEELMEQPEEPPVPADEYTEKNPENTGVY